MCVERLGSPEHSEGRTAKETEKGVARWVEAKAGKCGIPEAEGRISSKEDGEITGSIEGRSKRMRPEN